MNENSRREYPPEDEPDRRWVVDCDEPPPYNGRPSRPILPLLLRDG